MALDRNRISAVGFVIEGKLYINNDFKKRLAIIENWVGYGQLVGNHTYSHRSIDD